MKVKLDDKTAIVLHYYNYRDSSLIVNFFVRDFGKVSAVAKGIKGKKSKQNHFSLLQPFQKIKVSLSGKSELLILTNIESTSTVWKLSGKSLYCAYYLNELLLRLLPSHTDCSEIFSLYDEILKILSDCSNQQIEQQSAIQFEVPLRMFELKLLEYLGYGLNFSYDFATNSAIENDKQYDYIIGSGPTEKLISDVNHLVISGKTLNDLANGLFSDQKTLQQSKQLLKWALAEQLGSKPLKSREMFKQLYCTNKQSM